jgi:hypothetical protein
MMVYCNLMVTTTMLVDSNEMFVNEAIHQGTDMRHPMCPNTIFRGIPSIYKSTILGPKKGKQCCLCGEKLQLLISPRGVPRIVTKM